VSQGVSRVLQQASAGLYPGYFSLVMATGVVSLATWFLGLPLVPWLLFSINLVAYAVLWLLTLTRLLFWRHRLLADLVDHARGPGFFTLVAATNVLGTQLLVQLNLVAVALGFWLFGLLLWVLLTYGSFAVLIVHEPKPTPEAALSGGWLLVAVATQSDSVLGTLLAPHVGSAEEILFLSLCLYLLGGLQYLLIIGLIVNRLLFLTLTPAALTPPYWINMGALAISTLAGARLIAAADTSVRLGHLLPFLEGLTLLFWSGATWWIPLLLLLGVWRHVLKRFPLGYVPEYWGLVFPLGMYATCTFHLASVANLPALLPIPRVVVYVALLAWTLAFTGLLRHLASAARAGARDSRAVPA
jgi:tellurite resistance protein TehA-like permease